ncbi:MAG: hypothetical protein AAF633_24870 [Chloroflexota bacterium]
MRHRAAGWIPLFIILWNSFDIILHVAINQVEPLRVSGNVVGIIAVATLLLGFGTPFEALVLIMAAIAVVALNSIFALQNGFEIPMLVLIGVAVYCLIRWGQIESAGPSGEHQQRGQFYFSRWFGALTAVVGVIVVVLSGSIL